MSFSRIEHGDVEYSPKLSKENLDFLIEKTSEYVHEEHPEVKNIVRNIEDVEDVLSRYILNPEYFKAWSNRPRPKRYSKKTIVVDDVFYYVPYHYDPINYGMYFRLDRIWRDFLGFVNYTIDMLNIPRLLRIVSDESESHILKLNRVRKNIKVLVNSLFVEYIIFHYAHSVAHHVFEDIALIFENFGKGKYSMLSALNEENFCHYIAFTTLERYIPGVLVRSKKAERLIRIFYPLVPEFKWELVETINFATTKLLYAYYSVHSDNYRRPFISSKVRKRFELPFRVLWKYHYTYEEEIPTMKSKPFILRLFLTRY